MEQAFWEKMRGELFAVRWEALLGGVLCQEVHFADFERFCHIHETDDLTHRSLCVRPERQGRFWISPDMGGDLLLEFFNGHRTSFQVEEGFLVGNCDHQILLRHAFLRGLFGFREGQLDRRALFERRRNHHEDQQDDQDIDQGDDDNRRCLFSFSDSKTHRAGVGLKPGLGLNDACRHAGRIRRRSFRAR